MKLLKFADLAQGGFAGLKERRFVMDKRVFKQHKNPDASDGIKNFVYLADANFMPHGETGMHNHREIDVISVMVSGQIQHEGSLEHGQTLNAYQVQVQRAGREGFSHNEINPDAKENHMIQLWCLPDEAGYKAGYKLYPLTLGEKTDVYGGSKTQDNTFNAKTRILVAHLTPEQTLEHTGPSMAYLAAGEGVVNDTHIDAKTLISAETLKFKARSDALLVLIY